MTEDQLTRTLHAATGDIESGLAPETAWRAGRARRRRTTAAVVGLSAASAALVVVAAATLTGDPAGPVPAPPGPTVSTPTGLPQTPGVVTRDVVLPLTDPPDWAQLPEYPVDLGHWASPERPTPLDEDPVRRAMAAVQYDLGGGEASVAVIGDDGRWRGVDVTGLSFRDPEYLGVGRGSLSPDGTRLAIGQPEGVVVVDLTTAESTTYAVDGLGPTWHGRIPFWSADGTAVLIAQSYTAASPRGGLAYQDGWRVDLADGAVTRVGYDPAHSAFLSDGTVIADQWTEDLGHRLVRFDPDGGRQELGMVNDTLGALSEPTGSEGLWVARRETMAFSSAVDNATERSGFVALDDEGRVVALLPVRGVETSGGGGRVVGWLDETVVLIAMPGADADLLLTLAWDVATGQQWQGPPLVVNSVVSLPRP